MNKKRKYYETVILLTLFIILTVLVVKGSTLMFDEKIFNGLMIIRTSAVTFIMRIITELASIIGIAIMLGITLIYFIKKKKISDFKFIIINVLSGVFIMKGLKEIIQRSRPVWKWITEDGFSYPSGHTICAMLFYGTLIILVNKNINTKYKNLIILGLVSMIILTGISRIYFGVHYATDVISSIILGLVILLISKEFIYKEGKDENKSK
ncbi:MAG: phosphatase PAP2 family protein [Bacilli bacterium]